MFMSGLYRVMNDSSHKEPDFFKDLPSQTVFFSAIEPNTPRIKSHQERIHRVKNYL